MSSKAQNIVAFIYDKRGKLLSMGRNSYVKSHPMQASIAKSVGLEHKIYLHAEMDAIIKLRENDRKRAHKIIVLRTNNNGDYLNAKPCVICQKALELAGIEIIEHS